MVWISFNEGRAQKKIVVQNSSSYIRWWCVGMEPYLFTIRLDITFLLLLKICYIWIQFIYMFRREAGKVKLELYMNGNGVR